MSNDLVKRWDEYVESMGSVMGEVEHMAQQAIDQMKAAEAKLAKAVEALGRIADDCEADYPPSHGAIKHDARTTLAEIKGSNT